MIKALISANVSAGSRSRQRRMPSGIYLTGRRGRSAGAVSWNHHDPLQDRLLRKAIRSRRRAADQILVKSVGERRLPSDLTQLPSVTVLCEP